MSSDAQMELALANDLSADKSPASRPGERKVNKLPLEDDALILTPNASLAQQLRRRRLLDKNSRSSTHANIHILQRWITDSITPELTITSPDYCLASEAQLRYIWEQVITEQREKNQDFQQLNPAYLASQALSAWKSLKHWQISLDELAKAETGQLLSFRTWVIAFEKRLAKQKLSTIELEVARQLEQTEQQDTQAATHQAHKMPLVQTYAFIDELPPLWADWLAYKFENVECLGYISDSGLQERPESQALLCALDSSERELDAAMNWARSIFESDNQARIAIIDVNLKESLKATKRRAEAAFKNAVDDVRFSRETPLLSTGCVQTALKLLCLNKKQIDLATARTIVHSPLWSRSSIKASYQAEYTDRVQWDIDLCALQSNEIHTSDFLAITGHQSSAENTEGGDSGNPESSRLASIFSDRHRSSFLSPLTWCDLFQNQLQQLHCFEHFADSEWQRWIDALAEFAQLGAVCGDISISEALQQLEYCCKASSPKISSSAPGITFMDTVEAAADYSHIWIMGMDSMNWPGATRLNPLLPVSLQIQRQMPHSHPQLETELTRQLVQRLTQAADQVIFSYSQFNDDLEQSPCAFVAGFTEYSPEPVSSPESISNNFERADFEWIDCSTAPVVPKEQREVRGGASLLKAMAISPFDAFMQWRLGAYELDTPKVGLSALDRGNLVHNVLERVWNELGGSFKLDRSQIAELCMAAANKELKRFQARNGWLAQSFADLETERLGNLVADWLEVERDRPEFSVELTEEKLSANIAGLSFKMRLDRLDRLADGRLVLIDYKTGQSLSRNFWLDMPPVEPQLPLYALTLGDSADGTYPDALCFAKVRADKMEFIGIGSEDVEGMKGIQPQEDWTGLIERWRASLEDLATDYINGDTRAFETVAGFGRSDPFAPLHRFSEYEQLEEFGKQSGSVSRSSS